MRLVIAEKPSVAQSIAAVLGAKSRHSKEAVVLPGGTGSGQRAKDVVRS